MIEDNGFSERFQRLLERKAAKMDAQVRATTEAQIGALPHGSGSPNQVVIWSGSNNLTGYVGLTYTDATNTMFIDGFSDAVRLRVQGHSTQTSHLQDWENSAGTVLAHISGTGAFQASNISIATNEILTLTGSLTVGADTSITGGGTLALGGFIGTLPATGTFALLGIANVFTAAQTIQLDNTSALRVRNVANDRFLNFDSTNGRLGINISPAVTLDVLFPTTTTNAVVNAFRFTLHSTGTAAAGFGVGQRFDLSDDSGTDTFAGRIDVLWEDPTAATSTSAMKFLVKAGGAGVVEAGRFNSSRNLIVGGGTTTDLTARIGVHTAATTRKGVVIQLASGQSVNAFEVQNSSGVALTSIDQSGMINVAIAFPDLTTTRRGIFAGPTAVLIANSAQLTSALQGSMSLDQAGFNATASLGVAGCRFQGIVTGASGTVTGAVGATFQMVNTGAGIVTSGYGLYILTASNSGGGTLTTNYGLYIDAQTAGTTNYSIFTETGIVRFGGSVGLNVNAPDTRLHIGAGSGLGAITWNEESSTPANPTSGNQCRLYMKADKLVVQYNDGGTVRYKYLDLTGTGVTWTHTTSAP